MNHVRHVYGTDYGAGRAYAVYTGQRSTDGKFYSSLMFHAPLARDGKLYPWRQGQWEYEALHYTWPHGEALGVHLEFAIERVLDELGFTRENVPARFEVAQENGEAPMAKVLPFRRPAPDLEQRVA